MARVTLLPTRVQSKMEVDWAALNVPSGHLNCGNMSGAVPSGQKYPAVHGVWKRRLERVPSLQMNPAGHKPTGQ
jgi:hypothetical protein